MMAARKIIDLERTTLVVELRNRIAELESRVSSLDCRHAGRYYETSGSHCPLDKPCMRCKDERRIAELEAREQELVTMVETIRKNLHPRIAELESKLQAERELTGIDALTDELEQANALLDEIHLAAFGKHGNKVHMIQAILNRREQT